MAQQLKLEADSRKEYGKGASRRLKSQGLVPGVYYNSKGDNIPIQVPSVPLQKIYGRAKSNLVIELSIKDGKKVNKNPVLIKDIQFHPVKPFIEHVDFFGIDLKQELRVNVPINITGKSKGVAEGGILTVQRDYIEVSCLPSAIPETVDIDVTDMDINDTVHIEDIEFEEGVEPIYEVNFTILGVVAPTAEPEEEEEEELEEGVEGEEAEEGAEETEEGEEE